jgi:hypothetical protein
MILADDLSARIFYSSAFQILCVFIYFASQKVNKDNFCNPLITNKIKILP